MRFAGLIVRSVCLALWLAVPGTLPKHGFSLVHGSEGETPSHRSRKTSRSDQVDTKTKLRKPLASETLKDRTKQKLAEGKRLNRRERKEIREAERSKYLELRAKGVDEVSNTKEAAALRAYKLRSKKRKGLIRKKEASLADVLFPGVSPQEYNDNDPIAVFVDLVESRKTPIPYKYHSVPGHCHILNPEKAKRRQGSRKNLGSRLQGHSLQVAPYEFRTLRDQGCTPICSSSLNTRQIKRMKTLIDRQYRVQLTLDQLPVLMRSKEYNYAVRGYPIGFKAPKTFQGLIEGNYYLFNHLKFVVTYHEDPSAFNGVRITGFDVHPMSIQHKLPKDVPTALDDPKKSGGGPNDALARLQPELETCMRNHSIVNDPSKYQRIFLHGDPVMPFVYSYEVEWQHSELLWSDRWDVYLVGSPDDELHYFSIVNSLMIVLFLTGAISTIMIRTLRKDIAIYNEMDHLDESSEETGWKLVHGDVFRPPQTSPLLLSVFVGTGCQIGLAFALSMVCAIFHLLNPVQKGQTLTAMIVLYVLSGSIAGYVSARIYKYAEPKASWKVNVIATAIGLPGCLVLAFTVLNVFLSIAGAATAVSIFLIIALFLLWVCVSAPLVFIGSFFGFNAEKLEVPVKTNQIARVVPPLPWHVQPHFSVLMGGILPFGSVCIELAFIMSALWLHQIYYVMGFLFAVLLILIATCAQVGIVMTYLQLCCEDHRWWWMSFCNSASAGGYLFLYSLWFLSSRLQMVGVLPVLVYLTYMGMISICFGLFCGSVGFLSSLWFTRTIYGAVKVD